ncbi:unnamed protein product [Urochloa humidicola]
MAAAGALRPHITLLTGGGGGPIPSTSLQILLSVLPLPFRCRGRSVLVSNASSSPSSPPSLEKEAVAGAFPGPTAESCVNLGLELFSKGRRRKQKCCRMFKESFERLRSQIWYHTYDPELVPFRAAPEFKELQE